MSDGHGRIGGQLAEVLGRVVRLDVANDQRPVLIRIVLQVDSIVGGHFLRFREQNDRLIAVSTALPQNGVIT